MLLLLRPTLVANSCSLCRQNRSLNRSGQVALHQPLLPLSADAKIQLQHQRFQPHNSGKILQPHPTTRHPSCSFSSTTGSLQLRLHHKVPSCLATWEVWITNSEVSATAHQHLFHAEEVPKDNVFDPKQQNNASEPICSQIYQQHLESSLSIASINHNQSNACNFPHPTHPTTTSTS